MNSIEYRARELEEPNKIRRQCLMTLKENTQRKKNDFETNKGVRQVDVLSFRRFNLIVHYVLRINCQIIIRKMESQIVVYIDGVVIIRIN